MKFLNLIDIVTEALRLKIRGHGYMESAAPTDKSIREIFIEILSQESEIPVAEIRDTDPLSVYFNANSMASLQDHVSLRFGINYQIEGAETVADGIEKLEAHF